MSYYTLDVGTEQDRLELARLPFEYFKRRCHALGTSLNDDWLRIIYSRMNVYRSKSLKAVMRITDAVLDLAEQMKSIYHPPLPTYPQGGTTNIPKYFGAENAEIGYPFVIPKDADVKITLALPATLNGIFPDIQK